MSKNLHIKKEEEQWTKILSKNPNLGLILICDQKLCAVAHSIGEACDKKQITIYQIKFYSSLLKSRINKILELLNNLNFNSKKEFKNILQNITKIKNNKESYDLLKKLPEQIHKTSHHLCDELLNKST